MNASHDPSAELLDSLLRQQRRNAPDEELLANIDAALDAEPDPVDKPVAGTSASQRKSRAVPLGVAAMITFALGAGSLLWWGSRANHSSGMLMKQEGNPAEMRRVEVPQSATPTRYSRMWNQSPFTCPPPPASIAPPNPSKDGLQPADRASQQPQPGFNTERYGQFVDQPWKSPAQEALSTFSIDVDAASYTNVRQMVMDGRPVPPDAVRIEEFINYFDYRYSPPPDGAPFALNGTLAACPWQQNHLLARIAIKGREVANHARPPSNLVFLIDVSGSMQDPNKLPLLKRSLRELLDQLDERDRLGIVVYAGSEGVALPPTELNPSGIKAAAAALDAFGAGGSTNGGAGLKLAYQLAAANLRPGGVNRVILATDGDFNVGVTGQGQLVSFVKEQAAKGVSLTVLGFGSGNLNDSMMEAISNDGNGNYYYIDSESESRRVFQQKLTGTLVTIAKDVKIQVEFNPGKVKAYRLIGYANRILRHEDFNNDKVDAGDIGAGHTVTAFYEIVPQGVDGPDAGMVDELRYQRPANRETVPSEDWFTLKLRHKQPDGDVSSKIEAVMAGAPLALEQTDTDFRFASAVALCGMKLRGMKEAADVPWSRVEEIAKPGLADDPNEQRAGFIEMIRRLK